MKMLNALLNHSYCEVLPDILYSVKVQLIKCNKNSTKSLNIPILQVPILNIIINI